MHIQIPVLSLWQPWASSMELLDKGVETRHWTTSRRGLFAIHASKKWDGENRPLLDEPQFTSVREAYPDGLPLGKVVAVSLLTGCLRGLDFLERPGFIGSPEHALGLYEDGDTPRFGFQTSGTLRLQTPIAVRGVQTPFFPWIVDPDELVAAVGGATCIVSATCSAMGCLRCGHSVLSGLVVSTRDRTVCSKCRFVHQIAG